MNGAEPDADQTWQILESVNLTTEAGGSGSGRPQAKPAADAGKELPEHPSSKHKVTAQELLVDLSAFIDMEKENLRIFFPDDASLQPASEYAGKVYNYLVGQGCPTETAMRFTALALYDLVILVDDSSTMRLEEGGERIKTLKKVLKEVAAIYENARDEGILSIKFLNASQGKKDVTTAKLNAEPGPLSHIRWSGITKIGTQLENRILKNFVHGKKMTKPLLVMIITDGDVQGEAAGYLETVIINTVAALKDDKERGLNAIAFQFARIGNDEGAEKLLAHLDTESAAKDYVDRFPADSRLEDIKSKEHQWATLAKLMLGALYRDIDLDDTAEKDKPEMARADLVLENVNGEEPEDD